MGNPAEWLLFSLRVTHLLIAHEDHQAAALVVAPVLPAIRPRRAQIRAEVVAIAHRLTSRLLVVLQVSQLNGPAVPADIRPSVQLRVRPDLLQLCVPQPTLPEARRRLLLQGVRVHLLVDLTQEVLRVGALQVEVLPRGVPLRQAAR